MADDLTSYLDNWADLLAANVERQIRDGAGQTQADVELVRRAIEETRAALTADLQALRRDVADGVQDSLAGISGSVDVARQEIGGLAGDLAATRDRLASDLAAAQDRLVAAVDLGAGAVRQDLEQTGSEVARANAALESVQGALADLHQALTELPETIHGAINRDLADALETERQERAAAEFAALDDILALLDGVEVELEAGRQLLLELPATQRESAPSSSGFGGSLWKSAGRGRRDAEPPSNPALLVEAVERLVDGIQTTHRRLQDALTRRGVTPSEAVGARFDPTFHEAVAFEPCTAGQDGLVLREQRRGYRTADAVVRMAHVVVGRAES